MSEYWVSKKKYFCKYCEIYISDDAPSRQQHENGLRHKGNTERFIRSIYKAGEKKKKDEEEERREMARVEQAAQIAFAQDVGAGRAKLAGSSSSAPPAPPPQRKPPTKPSNPWANYSTAQSLGYEDPDAERIAIAKTQGTAGAWEVVAPEAPAAVAADAGTKRSAEELGEEEAREFKLRKRTITTGLGEIYDPGAITIKLKKREETPEESRFTPAGVVLPTTEPAPPAIKWEKRQWKKVSEPSATTQSEPPPAVKSESDSIKTEPDSIKVDSNSVKPEPESTETTSTELQSIKAEPMDNLPVGDTPAPTVFKKRKIPTGGRGRRTDA